MSFVSVNYSILNQVNLFWTVTLCELVNTCVSKNHIALSSGLSSPREV